MSEVRGKEKRARMANLTSVRDALPKTRDYKSFQYKVTIVLSVLSVPVLLFHGETMNCIVLIYIHRY